MASVASRVDVSQWPEHDYTSGNHLVGSRGRNGCAQKASQHQTAESASLTAPMHEGKHNLNYSSVYSILFRLCVIDLKRHGD